MRFVRRVYRAVLRLIDHDGLELSGHLAYTTIFAIFPFLIFLTALAGFLGSAAAATSLIEILFNSLPRQVAETLAPAVRSVLTNRHGGLLTVGIVATLFSASSGIEALRSQLNRAYDCPDHRPFWKKRLQSLAFVVIGAIAALLVSVLIIAGPSIINLIASYVAVPTSTLTQLLITQYTVAILVVIGALTAMHWFLPARRLKLHQLLPGIALTTVLLIVSAAAFSIYLAKLGDFSVTYGSLGGVVLSLLFFYIVGVVFSLGAEFNATADLKSNPEPSTEPVADQPERTEAAGVR